MQARQVAIIGAALVAATLGCRCPSRGCIPPTPRVACNFTETTGETLPPNLRELVPDCSEQECTLQPLPSPGETYQLLTASDAQCRAAANATIANMVALEEHWAGVIIECDSKIVQQNVSLQRDLLELHAADVRNKAAASALEAFYQLAGLEARKHYLELGILESTRTRERIDKLVAQGLPAEGLDRDEVDAQLVELQDQRLQVDYARVQLNGQLQKLLGCPISETSFFWPQVDWEPNLAPIDAQEELAAGLPNRFDLRGVELVLCNLEKTTLRVARGVLGVADSTLGSVEPTEGLVHRLRCVKCYDHEVDVRCRQLAMLRNETEQLATAEIKGAVYQVVMQQQRVALARTAVESRKQNVDALIARRDADDTPIFEISAARARLYDAESDLVEQVAALKTAEVGLKRSQAALAAECGFEPRLCCEGCCNGHCMRCQAPTCKTCELPCKCDNCRK
jgi:hypothetical protein